MTGTVSTTRDPQSIGAARDLLARLDTEPIVDIVNDLSSVEGVMPYPWMVGCLTETLRSVLRDFDRAVSA